MKNKQLSDIYTLIYGIMILSGIICPVSDLLRYMGLTVKKYMSQAAYANVMNQYRGNTYGFN